MVNPHALDSFRLQPDMMGPQPALQRLGHGADAAAATAFHDMYDGSSMATESAATSPISTISMFEDDSARGGLGLSGRMFCVPGPRSMSLPTLF